MSERDELQSVIRQVLDRYLGFVGDFATGLDGRLCDAIIAAGYYKYDSRIDGSTPMLGGNLTVDGKGLRWEP